ncbi:hypothetical protein AF335_10420 [Streptomyces eurocidicus]|uniref:Heparin-binding hemagglutinin n=1 Tax=Streptomyces eurocidicus TaxID=66423 RepID=A0A2N8NX24_STREU|nr:hypothetical protein [Streptomyces eurocidicus]MBB5117856.1 hypothetical protein [Streptomyces eurocidicus]MBF6056365.1 hypothetical protein [Streptomyces eurocidicus]PNE33323.1 hypothetical protein AF335_10420 [Streptomyces eurocidicus]
MATTEDIRKVATETAYAAAGAADLTAEKIGQLVAEAPERFQQLKNTDPKVVRERVTQKAKEAQATASAKFTEITATLDTDFKKLTQTAQDLALQGVGQAVGVAAKAGETYEKLAERGRVAVQTWRGEAAEEVADIAVAIEPDSAKPAEEKPGAEPAAEAGTEAPQEGTDEADADSKPAARRTTARKTPVKKADAKAGEEQ